MPGTPHVLASDEVAWLRARVAELEGLTARQREAARDRDELAAAQLAARDAQIAALAAQVEELRRRLDKDSSTSSKPPSSDSPYKSLIENSGGPGEAAGHDHDHGPVDVGFVTGGHPFVVADGGPVAGDPR